MHAYWQAVAAADPVRLQAWNQRGLTMPQLRLMNLLRDRESASLGELGDELMVSAATMTGLTDRLVRHGFIRRLPDQSDRRVVRVELTREGRQLMDVVGSASAAYMDAIFKRMAREDVDQLLVALARFNEAANAVRREAESMP